MFRWHYVNTEKVLYCFYKKKILKNTCESKTSQLCLHNLNTAIDQWERAYYLSYFIKQYILWLACWDEPTPVLRLVIWAGKIALCCPLWIIITRSVPQENLFYIPYNKSFIDQACSAFAYFLRIFGPRLCLGPWARKNTISPISSHTDLTLSQ